MKFLTCAIIVFIVRLMTNSQLIDDPLVALMVPRSRYAYMVQALAERLTTTADSAGPSASPPVALDQTPSQTPSPVTIQIPASTVKGWTQGEFCELRRLIAHNRTATALFELTCAKPGERVTFEEVYTHAGRSYDNAKADLSAFSRVKNARFGKDRRWPVEWQKIEGGHLIYWVQALLAQWWNAKD